jgi:hypothetical protein
MNLVFSLGGKSTSYPVSARRPDGADCLFVVLPFIISPLVRPRRQSPVVRRLPAMQVARKVPTDDPEILFYLRIAYVAIRECSLSSASVRARGGRTSGSGHVRSRSSSRLTCFVRTSISWCRGPHCRSLLLHVLQGEHHSRAAASRSRVASLRSSSAWDELADLWFPPLGQGQERHLGPQVRRAS